MSFISGGFRRIAGFVEVKQVGDEIRISGFSAQALAQDMRKIWSTSKIASNMFTKITWGDIRIPAFFAIELDYILNQLLDSKGLTSTKRILRNIIDGLRTNTWLSTINEPAGQWFNWKKLDRAFIFDSLLPHQMDFLKKYEATVPRYGIKGLLLAAAAGSGKSINGIALSLCLEAEVVIIVCPKNAAIRVWKKTLEEEMRVPQYPYVADLDGPIQPGRKYHVFHYEALDRAVQLAKVVSHQKVCIILDECHNLNEIKSRRTELFLDVCRLSKSQNIVWASGTPVKAMGFETIPLLRSLDPLFNEQAEQAFRKMYGRDAKRTLDILAHRLGLITHVVPKANVMTDKPVSEQIRVKIPNGEKYTLGRITELMDAFIKERAEYYLKNKQLYKRIYDEQIDIHRQTLKTAEQLEQFKKYQQTIEYLIRNGFDARHDGDLAVFTNRYEKDQITPYIKDSDTRKAFQNAKSVVKYVELKIRGECLGRILTKERIQCHVDMLPFVPFDNIITGSKKKTIVFTSYVKVVDMARDLLTNAGYKPLVVYGATNNELASTVSKFDKDESLNPLIATFQSLSTAVPLTMANSIIFLNNPWRSYEKEQAIARAHRLGQDSTVYCFDIILDTGDKPNISSRSLDIMEWSKDQVDKIMGITSGGSVSVECNGFITPNVVVDFNDVLDDVLISRVYRGPQVTDEHPDIQNEQTLLNDPHYRLYKN